MKRYRNWGKFKLDHTTCSVWESAFRQTRQPEVSIGRQVLRPGDRRAKCRPQQLLASHSHYAAHNLLRLVRLSALCVRACVRVWVTPEAARRAKMSRTSTSLHSTMFTWLTVCNNSLTAIIYVYVPALANVFPYEEWAVETTVMTVRPGID